MLRSYKVEEVPESEPLKTFHNFLPRAEPHGNDAAPHHCFEIILCKDEKWFVIGI
jgi:hypothetical protein